MGVNPRNGDYGGDSEGYCIGAATAVAERPHALAVPTGTLAPVCVASVVPQDRIIHDSDCSFPLTHCSLVISSWNEN